MEDYAKKHNIKFPSTTIGHDSVHRKTLSIFKDPTDPNCPVVIYMPILPLEGHPFNPIKSFSGFCNTGNSQYTGEQFDLLKGVTYTNFLHHKDDILRTIREVIDSKV